MRLRDEKKLSRVKQACIDLTFEVGVEGISASKLAKKANISASSIYIYFDNMTDMLQSINDEASDNFFQELAKGLSVKGSSREKHLSLWDTAYTYCSNNYKEFMLLMRMSNSCVVNPDLAKNIQKHIQPFQDFIDTSLANNELKEMDVITYMYIALQPMYSMLKANIESGKMYLSEKTQELLKNASWDAVKV